MNKPNKLMLISRTSGHRHSPTANSPASGSNSYSGTPRATLLSLIWFMGIYWIVDGVFSLIEGMRGYTDKSRTWMFIGGIVSIRYSSDNTLKMNGLEFDGK